MCSCLRSSISELTITSPPVSEGVSHSESSGQQLHYQESERSGVLHRCSVQLGGGGCYTAPHCSNCSCTPASCEGCCLPAVYSNIFWENSTSLLGSDHKSHTHTHRACINLTSLAVVFCFCVNPKQKLGVFHENLEAQSEGNKAAVPLKSTGGSTLSQTHRVKMNSSTARYKICLCASFYPNVSFTIRVWPI